MLALLYTFIFMLSTLTVYREESTFEFLLKLLLCCFSWSSRRQS